MMFAQDSTLVGDVDCSGEVNSQDASLILQFLTNVIDELPCQDNMTGLTPEQLQEIINMMDEQLNISYSGGSSNYPVMISSISSETMNWGEALIYCDGLEEDGYSDWFLPNLDQLAYSVGGGCDLPDERTDNSLWSRSEDLSTSSNSMSYLYESNNGMYGDSWNDLHYCRCVRFGEGETSEGSSESSNSSGSGSLILGNSEQPITMIGPMYLAEDFPEFVNPNTATNVNSGSYGGWALYYHDALRFCNQLNYGGFSDWHLPSLNQILHYIANNNSNQLDVDNFTNLTYESSVYFWTLTDGGYDGASPNVKAILYMNNDDNTTIWDGSVMNLNGELRSIQATATSNAQQCFCVR